MQVQWLDRGGNRTPLLGTPREYLGRPRLSPDGRRIAITIRDGADQDIWVYDAEREGMTRLTFGGGQFTTPVWSRDGRTSIFGSMGLGTFWARADGAGQPQVLLAGKSFQFPSSLTPVGNRLAFDQVGVGLQIWTVPLEENGRRAESGDTNALPHDTVHRRRRGILTRRSLGGVSLGQIGQASRCTSERSRPRQGRK